MLIQKFNYKVIYWLLHITNFVLIMKHLPSTQLTLFTQSACWVLLIHVQERLGCIKPTNK